MSEGKKLNWVSPPDKSKPPFDADAKASRLFLGMGILIAIAAPKRRWFRYSLRTLFAVVTVFGVWLGYELNWLRQRRAFITDEVSLRERHQTHDTWSATITLSAARGKTPPRAPGMLWAFGEGGLTTVCLLAEGINEQERTDYDWQRVRQARRLFPEATIQTVHVWETPEESGVSLGIPPN